MRTRIPLLILALAIAAFLIPTESTKATQNPVIPRVGCASSVVDQAAPPNCLEASSAPILGMLYPVSQDLFVDVTGNVGVGTITPLARLDVAGNVTVGTDSDTNDDFLFFDDGVNEYIQWLDSSSDFEISDDVTIRDSSPELQLEDKSSGESDFSIRVNASELSIIEKDQNATRLLINDDGNVGIGTISPSNILTVAQGSLTDPIADDWMVYSSIRWKENVEPIPDALEKVKRLRGVMFDWRANGDRDLGMIAEEVAQVFPELVQMEKNGIDAQSVAYSRLSAVLVEALKTQQAEIELLRRQVDALSTKIASSD